MIFLPFFFCCVVVQKSLASPLSSLVGWRVGVQGGGRIGPKITVPASVGRIILALDPCNRAIISNLEGLYLMFAPI